jgi:hypothetical protein
MRFNTIEAIILTAISTLNHAADADKNASDAAKRPLEQYIHAQQTGDSQYIRQAFARDARVIGYFNDALVNWSVEEYASRFSGKPAADEAQRVRSFELISITRDTAIGKIVLDYPAVLFTDYMALLKIDGEWKIVSKTFNALPKLAKK